MEVISDNPILDFLPDTLEAIRKIYNLDNGRMAQSVDILEQWVAKQAHFVNKSLSRSYLELTIVTCKGSVEKAKMRLDKMCTLKTLLPKFFISGGVKETFAEINQLAYVAPLPKMTEDYQRIYLIKISDKDFTAAQCMDFLKLNVALGEYLREYDYFNGFIVVEDFRDVSLMDMLTKININEFQQFLSIVMEGFGARIKAVHLITPSKAVDFFVKTAKTFISEKISNRIQVHADLEDLYRHVDKEILPVDLGGSERSIKELQDKWMDVLSSPETEKLLARMKASNTDESLRQTDKFNEQLIGLPGSFRTLTVD